MQKWEYLIVEEKLIGAIERSKVNEQINTLGSQGWELIAGMSDKDDKWVKLFFKRPK